MKGPKDKKWEAYEKVAAFVLDQCAKEFGLDRFEGKQRVDGRSGAKWQLDARGWADDGITFLIVECKSHAKTGISQALTASLAYAITDTGAAGGFLVSPTGLQKGALKVAAASNIKEIKLDPNSTTSAYFGEWLGSLRTGFADQVTASMTEHLSISAVDENGTISKIYDSKDDLEAR